MNEEETYTEQDVREAYDDGWGEGHSEGYDDGVVDGRDQVLNELQTWLDDQQRV